MTVLELLRDLHNRDIHLECVDNKLGVSAPKGAVTPEIRALLMEQKTDELKARRGEAERSAKNHPIQGTNADILKYALALLYRQLPAGVHVVLTVHDEIVLECPNARIAEATQILKDRMVQACREYLKVVHIPVPKVLEARYWEKD